MDAAAELFEAIRTGDTENVRSLCAAQLRDRECPKRARAVCRADGLLHTGRKEIRDVLVENGAMLELHEAAAAGNLTRVKEIVGANPELAKGYSPDGFPVLALAAAFGHEDVAQYLHSQGADINAIATNGTAYTGLTGAVAGGHASIAQWLAENGADVNYRYAKGHSPLLEAVANGRLDIVKILVAHGADPQARTDDGKTALAFAQERGHREVAKYLHETSIDPIKIRG